jgi:peptide deformylase
VDEIDDNIVEISHDMMNTMHEYDGVGLAANQIGVLKRIIVVDVRPHDQSIEPMVLINPSIMESDGEDSFEEGCLSIPEVTADVVRPSNILVRALSIDGRDLDLEATGILARAIQHEIDHLDGILFVDKASFMKRQLLKPQLRRLEQETVKDLRAGKG